MIVQLHRLDNSFTALEILLRRITLEIIFPSDRVGLVGQVPGHGPGPVYGPGGRGARDGGLVGGDVLLDRGHVHRQVTGGTGQWSPQYRNMFLMFCGAPLNLDKII